MKHLFVALVLMVILNSQLTACSNNTSAPVSTTGLPDEVVSAQTLMQLLNEKKVEEASALFGEEAVLVKENPCMEYFNGTMGYSFRELAYGQVLTITGKEAITDHLLNLVKSDFKSSDKQFWIEEGDTVIWQSQVLLDHTSLQAQFAATLENGKIKLLNITYSDLINFQ